jgi:hypothetical protein
MRPASIDRVCAGCGADISDKRPQATTCGSPRCRKRLSRANRRAPGHLQAITTALRDVAVEADFTQSVSHLPRAPQEPDPLEDVDPELELIAASNGVDGVLSLSPGCRKGPRRELAGAAACL